MQYQHNGALSWLYTSSTTTIMVKMAAVEGRASLYGAPETALERSFRVKRGNAESITVINFIDLICLLTQCAAQGL